MAELSNQNPLAAARKVLAARVNDPKVKFIPGLSDDLRAILGAFDEIDRRIGVCASVLMAKHFAQTSLHPAEVQALSELSDVARARYREGTHDCACTCSQCMRVPGR